MARNLPLKLIVAIGGAYVVVRSIAFLGSDAREFRDTIDYNQVADAGLLTDKFLAGDHPPTVPLVYKLLGDGDNARLTGQLLLSIASWLTLAGVTAATHRRDRVRVAGFAAVLVFSLADPILLWDAVLLSESVSISLTALLAAAWLWLARRPSWPALVGALAVTGLWTLARDPHAYVLLLLGAVLMVSLVPRDGRLLRALALAGVLAIAAVSVASASVGYKRWQYPLQNVVALRIAADPEGLAYFRDAGMPVTLRFLELSRRYRAGAEDPFPHPAGVGSPENRRKFLPFQLWLIEERGRRTYVTYLATHPGALVEPSGDLDHILLDPAVGRYRSGDGPWSFGLLADALYPPGPVLPLIYLALATALAVVAARRSRPPPEWAVPAFMVVCSLPFAMIAWHGEVLEIDRHGLIASIFLRLGTLLLALMAADRLAAGRSQDRPAPHASAATR